MADEETTQAVADEPQETETEAGQEPATEITTPAVVPNTVQDLPEWAQKQIKDLRSENAKHRTSAKAAEKAADEAARKQAEEQGEFKRLYEETKEKLEATQNETQALQRAVLRDKVAREVGLPAELAGRLTGDTEEEIKADAETLLAAIPKSGSTAGTDAQNGTGGATPVQVMSDEEIRELAAVYGVSFENLKAQLVKT